MLEIRQVPIYCNLLWPSHKEALNALTGDITLAFCKQCGHFFNQTFDPSQTEYTANYENSLHFSPRFNEYAESLAERLIDTYHLYSKDIIEIGCGKGDFLKLLCDKGQNRGVGFDRSYEPNRSSEPSRINIKFIRDFYNESHAYEPMDFLCCRHVLEHIERPADFLRNLRSWIGQRKDTVLYFEVPDALFTIKSLGIWDLIYEHCSYFSRRSLIRAFEQSGFEVLALGDSFGGQYLYVEAKPAEVSRPRMFEHNLSIDELATYVADFNNRYQEKLKEWRDTLAFNKQRKVVVWGGGSKGVTFLNVMREYCEVEYIVDLNPYKQGKFVPGTGQMVISVEKLAEYAPDLIVIMNQLYRDEIVRSLEDLNVNAEVICV